MTDIAAAFEGTGNEYVEYKRIVKQTNLSRLTLDMYVNEAIEQELIYRHETFRGQIYVTPKGFRYLAERRIIET